MLLQGTDIKIDIREDEESKSIDSMESIADEQHSTLNKEYINRQTVN